MSITLKERRLSVVTSSLCPRNVFFYRGDLLMAARVGHYKSHIWTFTTPPEELGNVSHMPDAAQAGALCGGRYRYQYRTRYILVFWRLDFRIVEIVNKRPPQTAS